MNSNLLHPITGEPKQCFNDGLFWFCNFVTRKNGKIIYRQDGGWLKFLSHWKKKKIKDKKQKTEKEVLNTSSLKK